MSKVKPVVDEIEGKVDQPNDRLILSKEEILTLKKTIGELSNQLDLSQQKIESLNEENEKLKVAGALAGEEKESTKDVKLKINELVREIDKCIALLNG